MRIEVSRELLCLAKLKEELHRAYERIVELGQTPCSEDTLDGYLDRQPQTR